MNAPGLRMLMKNLKRVRIFLSPHQDLFFQKALYVSPTVRIQGLCLSVYNNQRVLILFEFHDFVGFLGAAFTLIAYMLLQSDKISPTSFVYSILNFVGGLM